MGSTTIAIQQPRRGDRTARKNARPTATPPHQSRWAVSHGESATGKSTRRHPRHKNQLPPNTNNLFDIYLTYTENTPVASKGKNMATSAPQGNQYPVSGCTEGALHRHFKIDRDSPSIPPHFPSQNPRSTRENPR